MILNHKSRHFTKPKHIIKGAISETGNKNN